MGHKKCTRNNAKLIDITHHLNLTTHPVFFPPCRVRWDGHLSDWFSISAGVRQGGILSPDLYCIYVDDLICILQSLGVGCYIKGIFAAALLYADDMAVLAPSIKGLQRLLDACSAYCIEWDIKLNAKKTKNIIFGTKTFPLHKARLDGVDIPWEVKCKYLGVTLSSGDIYNCCIKESVGKFYRALNSIIRIEGRSDAAAVGVSLHSVYHLRSRGSLCQRQK